MLLSFARIEDQNGLHNEQAITIWLEKLLLGNQDIDGSAILNKANQFARQMNIVDFKGSEECYQV